MSRFVRDESGVALLEFAIFASLLLLLIFGSIDFGRAMFTANNLTAAAREGARYGAVLTSPGGSTAAIKTRVKNTFTYRFGGGALTDPMIAANCLPNCTATSLQSIEVRISYPFTWLTPLPRLMGQAMKDTLHARATFRWEGS